MLRGVRRYVQSAWQIRYTWVSIYHPTTFVDQPAQVYCETCTDNFCEVCFAAQHRKGTRKQHKTKPLTLGKVKKPRPTTASPSNGTPANGHDDEVGSFRHNFPD